MEKLAGIFGISACFLIFGRMKPFLYLFLLFHVVVDSFGQAAPGSGRLSVPVDFEVVNGDFKNAMVYMRKGDVTVATFKGASSMRIRMDYNSEYRLDFTKPGYITKSIKIDTHVSEDRRKIGFDPYKIGVRLFKQYEGVNIVVYNQPVAFIRFLPEMDEFGYDTDYTKSILSELKETEKILERKAREEREAEKLAELNKKATKPVPAIVKPELQEAKPAVTNTQLPAVVPVPDPSPSTSQPVALEPPIRPDAGEDAGRSVMGFGEGGDEQGKRGSAGMGEETFSGGAGSGSEEQQQLKPVVNAGAESADAAVLKMRGVQRSMETIEEKNRTITVFRIQEGINVREFRMVQYNWGGLFYFMNQHLPISQHLFESLTSPVPSR